MASMPSLSERTISRVSASLPALSVTVMETLWSQQACGDICAVGKNHKIWMSCHLVLPQFYAALHRRGDIVRQDDIQANRQEHAMACQTLDCDPVPVPPCQPLPHSAASTQGRGASPPARFALFFLPSHKPPTNTVQCKGHQPGHTEKPGTRITFQ